ncbi:MAG TPA: zf-HC2 domain-containing protein [Pyrinomonadaceae bacterium]|jgi:hypothetical protein
MKCDECLPLIEEFFDGELDEQTSEHISTHVSVCADCAAAFDALGCEQQLYTQYHRELEVTPALWQAIQTSIEEGNDDPAASSNAHASVVPFTAKLRERFGALFDVLPRLSPALATALALVAVSLAAALIWRHNSAVTPTQNDIAQQTATENSAAPAPSSPTTATPANVVSPEDVATNKAIEDKTDFGFRINVVKVGDERRRSGERKQPNPAADTGVAHEDTAARAAYRDDHPAAVDFALTSLPDTRVRREGISVVGGDDELAHTRLLDADEVEVVRHIQKTQLLLRSFRNARPPEEGDDASRSDVAYEKRLSRELLNENVLLRSDGGKSRNLPARQLLSTIEPLLLDIANLEDNPSKEDVRSIKERMRKMEIMAALEVYD